MEPKKDMQKVIDYERRIQLRIFRGQCFNNACILVSNLAEIKPSQVFDLAEILYENGLKRNWLDIKEE